jgi:hypothetical protein
MRGAGPVAQSISELASCRSRWRNVMPVNWRERLGFCWAVPTAHGRLRRPFLRTYAQRKAGGRHAMAGRLVATITAVVFAIGAFCGAGPTTVWPSPFGFLFLEIAILTWLAWKPTSGGCDRPGIWDTISGRWLGWR